MQKQLKSGLVLRSLSEGHSSDRDQLPTFYAAINTEHGSQAAKDAMAQWTRDLMSRHPHMTLDDFFVVVDPSKHDKLVSATLLIPHHWRYEDIPLKVGRPELVATDPEYRGHGLVRALFEAVHERSAELGQEMQVITGIPAFYRQFGYTMAMDLGQHASYCLAALVDPAPDYQPAFTLRHATADDVPNLMRWYDTMARGRLVSENRSADEWRYEIMGRSPDSAQYVDYQIIVNAVGQGVGYLELFGFRWDSYIINCSALVVGEEASYLAAFKDVMQGVKKWAINRWGECPALLSFGQGLHEAVDRLIDRSDGGLVRPVDYMWYVRVPEMIPFLQRLQPVLERRLEYSGAHRYTGEFKIGFYDLTGIRMVFDCGKITAIESITGKDGYDISFPWHMLWNVVFGQHGVDDLRNVLPEVWAGGRAAVMMDALFPKKKSWIKGVM